MIGCILCRVPTAGKLHSAAAPPTFPTFRQHPPLFRSTVLPPSNRVIPCNYSINGGVPPQLESHHYTEVVPLLKPRVQLNKSMKIEIYGVFLCSVVILCIRIITKPVTQTLPPGPMGLPLLGSLIDIGSRPHESLSKLAKDYGPLMTVKFGMVKIVIVSSSEMAKEIFQKHDYAFSGRPTPEAVTAEKNYDMSMVWASGQSPHWKKLRKICINQLFTTKRLDDLQCLRNHMMKNMVEEVGRACKGRGGVDIGRLVFGTSLSVLSNTMFSSEMFDLKSNEMMELKEVIGDLIELVGTPNVADYLPFLKGFDPQGIRRGITRSYEALHKVLGDVMERRVEHRAVGAVRDGDFLDVLLDHTEGDGDQELTYQNINVLLMDLFLGGTHTTTTLLEWALAELLHNPPILAKAKQELSNTIPPQKLVEEQDIIKLPYLDAVIKEALRLHPVAPLLVPHRTEQEVEINGYTIPKHTQVFVNIWSILRNPSYWDDPTSFKPERFLNSDIDFRGRNFEYIPFGAGRRICPGSNLAMRMATLMLANLVHSFDWELPNGLKDEDMDMSDGLGMTLHKHEPLVVIPVRY